MNTSTFKLPSILLPFIFLTACGGAIDDIFDDRYDVEGEGNSVVESLERADFSCSSNDCFKNVGLIAMNDSGYGSATGQCTGFLVADDIVATNSHCIPDSLKSTYYTPNCREYLAIRFHDQSGKDNIFSCKEMLNYNDHDNDDSGRDFAFFRINSTGRTPFKIHKNGIKDYQSLEVRRVTPLSYGFGGTSSRLYCKNTLNSFINVSATTPWFSRGALSGCEIVSGNSGSPIVDSNSGKVVGIGQATWMDSYKKRVTSRLRSENTTYSTFPKHTLYTSLSCVKDPVTNRVNDDFCKKSLGVAMGGCMEGDLGDRSEKIEADLMNWTSRLSKDFLYKVYSTGTKVELEEDGAEFEFRAEPICAKESLSFLKDSVWENIYNSLQYESVWDVDSSLRIVVTDQSFKRLDEKRALLELEYDRLSRLWLGSVTYKTGKFRLRRDKVSLLIPTCNQEMLAKGNYLKGKVSDEDSNDQELEEELKTCKELGS